MSPTLAEIARHFGCRVEDVRRQFADNAKSLEQMADRARKTGRKVNGYTAEKLTERAAAARARSVE